MRLKRLNFKIIIPVVIFFFISMISLYASIPLLSEAVAHNNFLLRQFIFYIAGTVLLILTYRFNLETAYKYIDTGYFIVTALLVILFIG